MSTVIPMQRLRLINNNDYEPVSDDSWAIQRTWAKETNFLSKTASDWLPTIEAALSSIQSDCRRVNWDGDGASPVADLTTVLAAKVVTALFNLLPKGTPPPDLIPEADGEICISWSADSVHMFSLSVGSHKRINFAGQFGNKGGVHAWQSIDETIPGDFEEALADVVRYVSRLYPATAARRAA